MPSIVVCTELVVDMFSESRASLPNRKVLGGAGKFTAIAAKALLENTAIPVKFISPISFDNYGQQFAAELKEAGVDISLAHRSSHLSMQARVFPIEGGNDYFFPIEVPADTEVSLETLPKLDSAAVHSIDPKNSIFIFGSVAAVLPQTQAVWLEYAEKVKELGGIVIYDLNAREKALPILGSGDADWNYYREIVSKWSKVAHVMKASDEDISRAFPGRSVSELMNEWTRNADLAIVTLGAKGCCGKNKSPEFTEIKSAELKGVKITVGAGDNFLAGVAVSLLRSSGLSQNLQSVSIQATLESGKNAAERHILNINPGIQLDSTPLIKTQRAVDLKP